ncbi:MAG: DUF4349 domain-containing protein [Sphingobacteriales bacterium]|nr:MAG: DUF4349 domain-containing protein [Sphingobacteriales bacterium]
MALAPPVAEQSLKQYDANAAVEMEVAGSNTGVDRVAFPPPADKSAVQADIEKKIIKEGSISFETENVNVTRKNILAALSKAGGYVSEDNESVNGQDNRKEYTLNIRIPAKNFDNFLGTVSETATKIDNKNIGIRDITTEYIDTKTRLDNKKILEKRYLELLNKAGKMSDVLEIENKLSEIRSDIESTQGQLNYMDKQVSYSSLSITFYTTRAAQVETNEGFGHQLTRALASGLDVLQGVFFAVIALWPLWLSVGVIYFVIKKWLRRAVRNEAD